MFPDMPSVTQTPRSLRRAGETIREARRNQGLSYEVLAHEVGVSGRTIRRIEDGGRPQLRVAFALANKFGLQVCDLWPE